MTLIPIRWSQNLQNSCILSYWTQFQIFIRFEEGQFLWQNQVHMEKWYLILPPSLTSVIIELEAQKFCRTYLSHTRYSISSMAHLRQVLVVLLKAKLLKIPYENHKDLIFFRPKNFIVLFGIILVGMKSKSQHQMFLHPFD